MGFGVALSSLGERGRFLGFLIFDFGLFSSPTRVLMGGFELNESDMGVHPMGGDVRLTHLNACVRAVMWQAVLTSNRGIWPLVHLSVNVNA